MVPVPVCNLWVAIAGFFNALVPASVREKPVDFFKREYGYFFKHEKKVKKLNEQMGKLKAAKLRVENKVEHALRDREIVYEEVHKWLEASSVKLNPEKTEEFNQAVENVRVQHFLGLCPNLWSRRRLSKEAEKEGKDVEKLLKEYTDANNFERVGDPRALRGIRPALVQEFEAFESRCSVFEGIMAALKDPTVSRIGVYGMPGVGKTMLVSEIGYQAREDGLFDEVVITAVNENPEIRKIQGDIADGVGLKLRSENESGRATEISDRLNNGQRILIILDNIWDELKLGEIGISSQGDRTVRGHKMLPSNTVSNCKLLMASRSQGVLHVMKSNKNFEVSILTFEESKVLFTKKAGNVATQPNYEPVADAIINKCVGLPLVIEAVAKALLNTENTSVYAWKDLRQKLERSGPRKINEVDESVYTALKLSYKMLKDKEAQQLFLLCGMHPQGANIYIIDLLQYSAGLGLFSDVHTLDEARTRVNALLHKLKSSSLLLKGDKDETVKMHDLFRDVAITIAEGDNMLVIKDEIDFKSPSTKQKLFNSTHISFPYGIHELPDTLECSKLEFLILVNDYPSLRVPDNFFQHMAELKVLDLTDLEKLSALPESLISLVNLKTLCLDWCSGMQDISSIGKLQRLDILSLRGSDIEELPEDMKKLRQLRVLNLSECHNHRVIPANIISSLTRLEELYMGNSFSQWDIEENASLYELKDLPHLKILEFHIFPMQMIPHDLYFGNLIAYKIFIGDGWKWSGKYHNLRQLKVKPDTGIHLPYNVRQLLQNTEDLRLDKLGVRDFLNELDSQGFLQLKNLKIKNSSCIHYLINFEEVISCCNAFPSLESLILNGLSNLEKICHGQPVVQAFVRLKTVKVEDCGKLKNLFTCSMVKYLLQLEEIEVNDCDNLVEILGGEMVNGFDATESVGNNMEFLKNVRSLTLQRLPKFVSLLPQGLMQSLFNEKVLLPQLEELQLSMINVKQMWQDRMPLEVSNSLGNLTNLIIENCNHLEHLFSFSITRGLERLKRLQVSGCENIRMIVVGEEREATNEFDNRISFSQLNFLKLKGLENLVGFCSGNHDLDFPCLKELEITMCSNFEGFSPMSYIGFKPLFDKKVTLPNVETITISHIKSERLLMDDELVENAFSKLKELKVKFCENLEALFASNLVHKFKGLERLYVEKCNALEAIFEFQIQRQQMTTSPITEAQLKVLWCWHLPKLKHLWSIDPQGVATFHKLYDVDVWNCEKLGNVLPASVARGLPQLEKLAVFECEKMEEIVASTMERGDKERGIMFEFPRASVLQFWELPNLKSFYRGRHTTNWPMLRTLQARHCGELKIFSFTHEMHQIDASCSTFVWQQPLFSSQQVISGLEQLLVEDVHMIKCISEGGLKNVHMDHVKALIVCESDHSHANEVANSLPEFLKKFPNLQDLQLTHCIGVRLVPQVAVPHLKRLALYRLPNLEQSWSQHCNGLLNSLETLELIDCPCLNTLSHSWASFQNLTTLYMCQCHQVAHVLSPSTASTLVQLKEMTIIGCRMLTHVISREEEGETSKRPDRTITFNMLKIMRLENLPRLTCFSATTATLSYSFPSLKTLTVKGCPELRIFCQGWLHTPVLKGMQLADTYIDEADDRHYWFGDIDTTVQKIRCLRSRAYKLNEVEITNTEGELAQLMELLYQYLDIRYSNPRFE